MSDQTPPLTDTDVAAQLDADVGTLPPVDATGAPDAAAGETATDTGSAPESAPDAGDGAPESAATAGSGGDPDADGPDADGPDADADAPGDEPTAAALATPSGEVVERVQIEGTQIDPADGIRKPADQIDAPPAPDFGALPTSIDGVSVLRDKVTTQIGPDGKRYPINPDESAPTARHDG